MSTIQDQIVDRIRQSKRGSVFTPKDFLDLGGRAATDQALSRLAHNKRLRRLGRGLYYYPRTNPRLGIDVPPDPDAIATAIARRSGHRLAPSGAVAANRLGLSTQVPAKARYLSDGRSRRLQVGSRIIEIKHVAPKHLPAVDDLSAMVFQALHYLGRDAADDRVIAQLRHRLSAKQLRQLAADARYAPGWIADVVRRLTQTNLRSAHG